MKLSALKMAVAMAVIIPSVAYAEPSWGSKHAWGTQPGGTKANMNFCEVSFGPRLFPCWSPRFEDL